MRVNLVIMNVTFYSKLLLGKSNKVIMKFNLAIEILRFI